MFRITDWSDVMTGRREMTGVTAPADRPHFLQIPGPTNVPDEVLRAISAPTIDHRGPEFAALGRDVLAALRRCSDHEHDRAVVVYPGLGHRRLGGGAGQHAVDRRPGARLRDRVLRDPLADDGRARSG